MPRLPSSAIAAAALLAMPLLAVAPAAAQQPPAPAVAEPPAPIPPGAVTDFREAMRVFVQRVAAYARTQARDFSVVPMDGLDLLVKTDPVQPDVVLPARTYSKSIGGVLQEGLFWGVPESDKPTEKERRDKLLPLAERAKKEGLKVLVMDYASQPRLIDEARALAAKQGFAFFAAPAGGLSLNALPRYPRRPYSENGDSVLSLRDVRNFVMLRDTSAMGRQDEFALRVHDTNYDLVVVDVFHTLGVPLSRQAVETLKYKKLGARRLVFAYADIGSAASYAYYWKPGWKEGSPRWISAPLPTDPDRYFVEYWQPEWQQIVSGGPESYVFGIVRQGFDGVILDGVRNYLYYEGGLEAYQATK